MSNRRMRMGRKFGGPALGALLLSSLALFSLGFAPSVQNTSAPVLDELRLVSMRGALLRLPEVADGKPTALIVMKGPWCPACVTQVNRLMQRALDVEKSGGRVAVLTDLDVEENRALAKKHGWAFQVYGDPSHGLLAEQGMWHEGAPYVYPGVIFLDACGEVAYVGRGRRPGQIQDPMMLKALRSLSSRPPQCGEFT